MPDEKVDITRMYHRLDKVANNQDRLTEILIGSLDQPDGGLMAKVRDHGEAVQAVEARAGRHSADIKALNESRDEVLVVVRTARWAIGIASGTTVLAGIGWLLWFFSGGKVRP